MATAHQTHLSQKFKVDKSTVGDITYLKLHGVVDETFDGKKVAESIRTHKLVLSLLDVRRFASWGMAEWMNFLRGTAEKDVYLVECSTYAVNQMNLVTGLLGHGKLVSFYSSYRCGSCSEEFEMLMLVPTDRAALRDLAVSEQICTTCGGRAPMDRYPAAMCAAIAERPAFDIDDEVVAFLRSQLKYNITPDANRFRAGRRVSGGYTYLRLTGNLATLPAEQLAKACAGTTVVDLAGVVFDPADLTSWRTYVQAALPGVTSLQLLDCPPGFLETAVHPEDLRTKLKIRTFAVTYRCWACDTETVQMVDVAQHLEQLVEGTIPSAQCPGCKAVIVATMSPEYVMRLPARERDAALDGFLTKARAEPASKLEDCLVVRAQAAPTKASGGLARPLYLASVLGVLILAGLAVVAVTLWQQRGQKTIVAANPKLDVVTPPAPTFKRPEWIVSDVPSSALCHELINRMTCVGVSSYRPTRNEAVGEANDAALEEMVNAIGLKISTEFFRDRVLSSYSEARAKALSALQAVEMDRTSTAYAAADDVVRKARKRVVEILQASGGAAVPAQRSDWYWEEYAGEKGAGTEVLVFVRYDITLDAVKALVERYSTPTAVLGTTVITAFPSLAWQHEDFTGGVILTKVGKPLSRAGLAAPQVVMAVGDQRVSDASGFAKRLEGWTSGELALTVKSGDGPAKVIAVRRK